MKNANVESVKKNGYAEINAIGEDLSALKSDVTDLVKHVKEDGLNDLSAKAKEGGAHLQDFGRRIEKAVAEKPAQSMALAFAGGLLASLLLGGRR